MADNILNSNSSNDIPTKDNSTNDKPTNTPIKEKKEGSKHVDSPDMQSEQTQEPKEVSLKFD